MSEVTALLRIAVKEEVSTQMGKARKEMEGFKQQTSSTAGVVQALFRELAGPAAGLGVAAGIAAFAKASVSAASDLQALRNRAEVVFGQDFPAMEAAAAKMAAQLRRSSTDMLGFTSDFTALMSGVGIGKKAAQEMAVELTELSVAFGKAFHMADADAFQMLQAGMRGNSRELARLGIIMDDNAVKQYAMSRGLVQNTKDLNEAQMMVLRYNFLQEKTGDIQAIAAKETGGLNDEWQRMIASLQDLNEEAGKPFLAQLAMTVRIAADAMSDLAKWLGLTVSLMGSVGPAAAEVSQTGQGGMMRVRGAGPSINPEKGWTGSSGVLGADKDGNITRDRSKWVTEQDQRTKDLIEQLKKLVNASGGTGKEIQKLRDELEGLADEYDQARERIRENLADLDTQHADRMGSMKDQIDGVTSSMAKMESQYQRTMDGLAGDEIESVAKQVEKLSKLKKEMDDTAFFSGKTGEDGFNMLQGLRQGKDLGDVTKTEAHGFGWSDDTVKQINAFMELQKQQASLDRVLKGRPDKEQLLTAGAAESQKTDFEKEFAQIQERRTFEKQQYEESRKEKQDELDKLEAKKRLEQEAYTIQRQELVNTTTALGIFHDDYALKMQNMKTVTEESVKSMKKNLEELQKTLSASQALTQAKFNVSSGVDVRREERIQENAAPQSASGGVTVVIQSMTVEKTADADEVVRRITRQLELQRSNSN